jgi:hypothetical protein
MGCSSRNGEPAPRWQQQVHTIALDVAQPAGAPLRIMATDYDTYTAVVDAAAVVNVRVGHSSADPYNIAAVPLRRGSAPFGDLYFDWPAQAGKTLVLILGIGEEVGIR